MPLLRVLHTRDLSGSARGSIRALLDGAFAGTFTDDDWEHTLGGIHLLAGEGNRLVGHVAVVQRRLLAGERSLRTGYVEGLAVEPAHRRHGVATLLMGEVERVIDGAYDLGALSDGTGIPWFYDQRGWFAWRGPTGVLGPSGPVDTPEEDGTVLVRRTPTSPRLDPTLPLRCDWRPGDVW